ncbi:MAG: hypothetical protein EOP00_27510 [Pedobacter sp.]|nr:MAG: hypothetical protein EOP00_27510 [Pedobacter sp.]
MKKLFLFLAMASTTMFVSCGSDDNAGGTPSAASITLTASTTTVEIGAPSTLTVKNNLSPAVDVTSSSTFVITPATGASITAAGVFTATTAGSYSIVAKNGPLTSAALVITVNPAAAPAAGKITFSGTDYDLDNMAFVVHGANGQITVVDWAEEGQPEEWVSVWVGYAYSGDDVQTSQNYYEYFFTLPATVVDGEVTAIAFPGESDATFVQAYAEGNGAELDLALDTLDGASLTFASFAEGATENDPWTSENASSLTSGTTAVVSHSYNGELVGVGTQNLLGSGRGAKVKGAMTFSKQLKSKTITMKQLKKINR